MTVRYCPEPVGIMNGVPVPGRPLLEDTSETAPEALAHALVQRVRAGRTKTMAYKVLNAHAVRAPQGAQDAHATQDMQAALTQAADTALMQAASAATPGDLLRLRFDALISHDITYVGIIQTARASGLESFPVPYALTNCHNSLCAVGGTINEDDHVFGLSAAHRFGGIYVPANMAVIHQFARERLVGAGQMILGSDSHTRYGSYGCMGFGEGGGELVKQLLSNTYDVTPPEVVLVWMTGSPRPGVGPHDVALALVAETFPEGRVKNRILEFAGPGIAGLSLDFRAGIDVMTTETSCLSSLWETDQKLAGYYAMIGKPESYRALRVEEGACYDALVTIELDKVEPMIALPFHPSKAYPIAQLVDDAPRILGQIQQEANEELGGQVCLDLLAHLDSKGRIQASQGVIVGCAGGLYDNLSVAAALLKGASTGNDYFNLSVYPASETLALAVTRDGTAATLMEAGAVLKPAFCGPCFGAGDTPSNGALSLRHATRNFANREGAKPGQGQVAGVALMDARSIAATARARGVLTPATALPSALLGAAEEAARNRQLATYYEGGIFDKRCYFGFGNPEPSYALRFGPGIANWPPLQELGRHLLLKLAAVIHDPVTTTDELIPSGETSSYRSNPLALAEFTLSRRVPEYVERSKQVRNWEERRLAGTPDPEVLEVLLKLGLSNAEAAEVQLGSALFATKPGDGSAREQAASCQKVLGGAANIACEYATKRYRSNCINWGLIPFTLGKGQTLTAEAGDYIFVPGVRAGVLDGASQFEATVVSSAGATPLTLHCAPLSPVERQILASGCLINYYKNTE